MGGQDRSALSTGHECVHPFREVFDKLDSLLEAETSLPIHLDEEPMTCVVRGAGIVLNDWTTYQDVGSV